MWFVKQAQPLVHTPIGGDAEARPAVPLDDELIQVVALLGGQPPQAKVIQDDQIRRQIAAEHLLVAAVGSGLAKLGE